MTVARFVRVSALVVWLSCCALAFTRSLIPVEVNGHVTALGYVDNTGYQLWSLEIDDDRSLIVDHRVGGSVEVGELIEKPRWSTRLSANGGSIPLGLSSEFVRFLGLGALLALATWVLTSRRPVED